MYRLPWLAFYILISVLAVNCPGQTTTPRNAPGTKVSASLQFEMTAEKTQLLVLDVLLPQTEPGRQKVVALDYTVEPNSVFVKDGQRYAQFRVEKFPAELTINLQVEAYRFDLATARAAPQASAETKESLAQWLVYEQYLEKDNAAVKAAAKTLTGKDDEAVVRACFDHTVKSMKKTPYTDKDLGAIRAIYEKRGDCTEFADVFISLCRAKGIPARFCQGYLLDPVIDTPKHDWAEVHFDKLGWVPFDPLYAHLNLRTNFSDLRPIYLTIERNRRNAVLNFNHFWSYRYEGDGPVKIKDTFTVTSRVDLR